MTGCGRAPRSSAARCSCQPSAEGKFGSTLRPCQHPDAIVPIARTAHTTSAVAHVAHPWSPRKHIVAMQAKPSERQNPHNPRSQVTRSHNQPVELRNAAPFAVRCGTEGRCMIQSVCIPEGGPARLPPHNNASTVDVGASACRPLFAVLGGRPGRPRSASSATPIPAQLPTAHVIRKGEAADRSTTQRRLACCLSRLRVGHPLGDATAHTEASAPRLADAAGPSPSATITFPHRLTLAMLRAAATG